VQRLVLFLGHPSYALTVVIFTLLLASGIGSYWSRRMLRKVAPVAAAVAILALTGAVALLLDHGVGWPLWVKVAATMVVIGIPGFVMGMPFPQALADLEKAYPAAVRWAWSLNAAASVAGSVGAIFCGVYLGLRAALFIGVGFYIGAWLLSRYWRAQLEPLH
jgi:hypothetical protein